MSRSGFVYVLFNPSLEGMVKIGRTERDPNDRIRELSSATGVPTPFVLAYDAYFENCIAAEQYVHELLEKKGLRTSSNREFFNVSISEAVKAINKAKTLPHLHRAEFECQSTSNRDLISVDQTANDWLGIYEAAEACYYGFADELEDHKKALSLYKKAARLGALKAYRRLGQMYMSGDGCTSNTDVALEYFKQGANKDDIVCYAEMGVIFLTSDKLNIDNANKCWKKYFSDPRFGTEASEDCRYALAYCHWALKRNITLECATYIKPLKTKILEQLEEQIQWTHDTRDQYTDAEYSKLIMSWINSKKKIDELL